MTTKAIFEEGIPEKLAANPELVTDVNAVCQVELDGDEGGTWTLDLTKEADWITPGVADNPECSLKMSVDDFIEMYEGKVSGFELFTSQKLIVSGPITLALKLNTILEH